MTPRRATSPAKGARSTSPNGAPGTPEVVVAWHGLARTGRDMDPIAAVLAQRFRVICPDTLGRGLSQWSPCPPTSTAWPSTSGWRCRCWTSWAWAQLPVAGYLAWAAPSA
jgi:pimeloyl-ACP methyl ester carboxylesterase